MGLGRFLGILYIIMFGEISVVGICVDVGPRFIAGILFLINWRFRKELRAGS